MNDVLSAFVPFGARFGSCVPVRRACFIYSSVGAVHHVGGEFARSRKVKVCKFANLQIFQILILRMIPINW